MRLTVLAIARLPAAACAQETTSVRCSCRFPLREKSSSFKR